MTSVRHDRVATDEMSFILGVKINRRRLFFAMREGEGKQSWDILRTKCTDTFCIQ